MPWLKHAYRALELKIEPARDIMHMKCQVLMIDDRAFTKSCVKRCSCPRINDKTKTVRYCPWGGWNARDKEYGPAAVRLQRTGSEWASDQERGFQRPFILLLPTRPTVLLDEPATLL